MADDKALDAQLLAAMPEDEEDGDLEQLSFLAEQPMVTALKGATNGKGRPKGSLNRKTRDLAKYILARHRHPVIGAAQIVDMPLDLLAGELGCTKVEALNEWRKCAEFVARFTCQAMPQAVNVNAPLAGFVTVINLAPPRLDLGPVVVGVAPYNGTEEHVSDDEEAKGLE